MTSLVISKKYCLPTTLVFFLVVGFVYWSVAIKWGLIPQQSYRNFELEHQQQSAEVDLTTFPALLETSASDGTSTHTDTDVISMTPIKFLANFKNPCWYGSNETKEGSGIKPRLQCLPYFFIAGFPKCATTDLFARLVLHPDIVRSRHQETHWWSRLRFGRGQGSIQKYVNLQAYAAKQIEEVKTDYNKLITVDGSPSTAWFNFYWRKIPQNDVTAEEPSFLTVHALRHLLPDAKFIFIMREPISRLYSEYLFLRLRYGTNVSSADFHRRVTQSIQVFKTCTSFRSERACVFDQSVAHAMEIRLYPGLYALYLEDWFNTYSKEQLLFLKTEDYGKNMPANLKIVFDFLDVVPLSGKKIDEIVSAERKNTRPSRSSDVGPMWDETRTALDEFYSPYNERLARMLDDEKYLWHSDL